MGTNTIDFHPKNSPTLKKYIQETFMPEQKSKKEKQNELTIKKYHLGCGTTFLKNWINIGYWSHLENGGLFNIDGAILLNHDLRLGIPAEDSSLEAVYHSHLLEHLNYKEGLSFIAEIHRVMQPNGLHRIIIPDLEAYAKAYLSKDSILLEKYREHILKNDHEIYKTPASIFMGMLHNHEHKWGWDWETIKWALERQGFKDIKRTLFQESEFEDIENMEPYSPVRCLESLCVECRK